METWLKQLLGEGVLKEISGDSQPAFLQASTYAEGDIGTFAWSTEHNKRSLKVTNDGRTIEWPPRKRAEGELPAAWVPATTCLRLHSGHYQWDFVVDEMARCQIGVGYMLLWDTGPDWGFFGYLGAGQTAVAYDPSTGDVVCATRSIEGGLPKFENGRTGVVTVEMNLPREAEGEARFVVSGTESTTILLPRGAVMLPAACLLKETQKITLSNFTHTSCR